MISIQGLAIITPVIALFMVAAYAAFEYRRIERSRLAEETELASKSKVGKEHAPSASSGRTAGGGRSKRRRAHSPLTQLP